MKVFVTQITIEKQTSPKPTTRINYEVNHATLAEIADFLKNGTGGLTITIPEAIKEIKTKRVTTYHALRPSLAGVTRESWTIFSHSLDGISPTLTTQGLNNYKIHNRNPHSPNLN